MAKRYAQGVFMKDSASLLVKIRGDTAAFAASEKGFGRAGFEAEPILTVPARPGATDFGITGAGSTWLRVAARHDAENPWDAAHALIVDGARFGLDAAAFREVEAIEPDFEQQWPHQNTADPVP